MKEQLSSLAVCVSLQCWATGQPCPTKEQLCAAPLVPQQDGLSSSTEELLRYIPYGAAIKGGYRPATPYKGPASFAPRWGF